MEEGLPVKVSQCSPAWKTGTIGRENRAKLVELEESQCSPAWKTGTIGVARRRGIKLLSSLNVVRPGRPEQFPFSQTAVKS